MRYKILVNGKKPAVIKDFLQHTGASFVSLSTSDIWEDIDSHIDIFKPDAFLCFYDSTNEAVVESIKLIVDEYRLPIVISADEDDMLEFERKAPTISALKLIRPTSLQEMQTEIPDYIERRKSSKPTAAESPTQASAVQTGASAEDLIKSFEKLQSKKQMLVVDDDRTVLKLLKTALSEKYEVTAIAGGTMAEKYLETRSADLILLDYEMPDKSGSEVFKTLKSSEKTAEIPVVFLTGVADMARIKEVLSLGPRGYLLKPINMERLTSTITEILG